MGVTVSWATARTVSLHEQLIRAVVPTGVINGDPSGKIDWHQSRHEPDTIP
jgi:hypothetical protein